ncbi:MAG: GH1 family beta-glucosidase [Acidimicrobiia bacterium]
MRDTPIAASASITHAGRRFPAGFVWGSATSAFQIEGGAGDGERGESIWDRFCATPGTIADGSDGTTACDHVGRWRGDVELMRELGLGAYRFSISWPRVLPAGCGAVNGRGLDFYDRLVDELLAADITPYPTLYHWDLPQALEDAGGWPTRQVPEAFADFAEIVAGRLGDRVEHWTTINEPFVVANHGYLTGEHAPGRSSLRDSLAASHHLLVGHGMAMERVRAVAPGAKVGIVLNFTPSERIGDSPAAIDRQRIIDDIENRWYVEPLAGLGYPSSTAERLGWDRSEVLDGDLELIARPVDLLGVNFYTCRRVGAFEGERQLPAPPSTAMGWEIDPASFGSLLRTLHERYHFPRYVISENGAAMPDGIRRDGRIDDLDRIEYLHDHLAQVHDAIADGVPVDGYFVWSLLDNFEWAHGYRYRFGIVEVDPATLERIPKRSALWYSDLVSSGELPPAR